MQLALGQNAKNEISISNNQPKYYNDSRKFYYQSNLCKILFFSPNPSTRANREKQNVNNIYLHTICIVML